jgi:hypothetical protein
MHGILSVLSAHRGIPSKLSGSHWNPAYSDREESKAVTTSADSREQQRARDLGEVVVQPATGIHNKVSWLNGNPADSYLRPPAPQRTN